MGGKKCVNLETGLRNINLKIFLRIKSSHLSRPTKHIQTLRQQIRKTTSPIN